MSAVASTSALPPSATNTSTITKASTSTSTSLSQLSPKRKNLSPAAGYTQSQPLDPRYTVTPDLFYLVGDNAPTLLLGKKRVLSEKAKGKRAQKWTWSEFDNQARKDGLRLWHWEKGPGLHELDTNEDDVDMDEANGKPYPFAKYNVSTNVYSYSTDEYISFCRDESGDWSKEETDYLFNLCHQYDLRWFVIRDRWDWLQTESGSRNHNGQLNESQKLEEADQAPASIRESAQTAPDNDTVMQDEQSKQQAADTASSAPDAQATQVKEDVGTAQDDNTRSIATGSAPADVTSLAEATVVSKASNPVSNGTAPRERTLEEMKDRYYSICRRLIRNRPASDENAKSSYLHSYSYDKDRETLRKRHIREQIMSQTPEQIAEEEFLYVESRRLEQTYARTARDRDELWRLLGGVGPQSSSALALNSPFLSQQAQANAAAAAGLNSKKRRRGELDMLEQTSGAPEKAGAAPPALTTVQDEQFCITRYNDSGLLAVSRPSGVYLRSSKPPALKTSLAPKIQALLAEQKISMRLAMPTKANMEKLEGLVTAISSLLDCKKQVERAEHEVKILRTRKDAAMRIEAEDRRVAKMEADEKSRKDREASGVSGGALTPQGESSSAASSMQVDT